MSIPYSLGDLSDLSVNTLSEKRLFLGPSGPLDLHAGSGKVPSSTSAD